MNVLISKIFIFILATFFSVALYAFPDINLYTDCSNKPCTKKKWYVIDNFQPTYTQFKELPHWQETTLDRGIIKDIFPHTSSTQFSYITDFSIETDLESLPNLGIVLGGLGPVFSLYINGKLLIEEGSFSNGKITFNRFVDNTLYEIPSSYLKQGKNILFIHVQGEPEQWYTGFWRDINTKIGSYSKISHELRDKVGIILNFSYLIVGLYHLFLFYRRTNEVYNLYFGTFCVFIFCYFLLRFKILFEYGFDSEWEHKLEFVIVMALIPLFIAFLESLIFSFITVYTKIYSVFCALLAIPIPFVSSNGKIYLLMIWQASAFFATIHIFYILYRGIRKKNTDAKNLFVGTIILVISALYDIIDSRYFNYGFPISRFGFFAFVVGSATVLVNRFLKLYDTIEYLNKNLEKKVESRTIELKKSLQEVHKLKERQDGDYFLTTLIVSPLMTSSYTEGNIKVDILIKQKKEFEFMKRTHRIGGDICIAETIDLCNKKFTAFVNGDAMGKSLQGAGGAIVLGAVFKSILSRTRLSSDTQTLPPENWLKLVFIEIQEIFESFNGAMLMSVVIGILDNSNGFVYYINAEHPWVILYRDNKASFIENELSLHKLGIDLGLGKIVIKTFQMLSGDSLISGSDGRDDIILDPSDPSSVNQDVYMILDSVEKSKGELNGILDDILKKGTLMDDFSLLKINYTSVSYINYHSTEDLDTKYRRSMKIALIRCTKRNFAGAALEFERANSLKPYNKKLIKVILRIYKKLGNYYKMGEFFEKLSDIEPMNEEHIYLASRSYFLGGDLQKASKMGERLKLRDPYRLDFILNLVEIYIHKHNLERATKLLAQAKEQVPDDIRVVQYKEMIDSGMADSIIRP